ncbi:lipase family protein [Congregibacter sp.]|uniref:lipase family protein n=1 Tax=Congregibacter sp. TaxID=2744308 RepID=UPI003F6D2B95
MKYAEHFRSLRASNAYDPQNALSLALACELSYASLRSAKRCVEKTWGYEFLALVSRKKQPDIDTQCFIMADDNNIVVVFRGSDSGNDWFANFQASQDPGPFESTGAHEGFQDSLYPAVIKLTEILRTQADKPRRVWITGHSLGGALCSLYAGMLLENDIDVYGVYTFASPRPGDAKFASALSKSIEGPHYRVVNSGDVVPHVPPEPFFSHPGSRVILKHNHKKRTKGSWLDERIAALKNFVKMTGKRFDLADNHRLASAKNSYIPRLIDDLAREERARKR